MASGASRGPDLSCPLCYENYEVPMLLSCYHRLCNNCLQHLQNGGTIKCPECKKLTPISDAIIDDDLQATMKVYQTLKDKANDLFDKAKSVLCTVCKTNGFRWLCEQCNDQLCDECKANHNTRLGTTSCDGVIHKIVEFEASSENDVKALTQRVEECNRIIDSCNKEQGQISEEAENIERRKNDILVFLRRTQQQIVDMVNSYFTSIDEAYLDATPEEMDIINAKLESLRNDPKDPCKKLSELKKYTSELISNAEEAGECYFDELQQLHLEQLEEFRNFYGTPFKLPEPVGNETRRLSNLHRSKLVLEAISTFDNSKLFEGATCVEDCLPSTEEVAMSTGLKLDDVKEVLRLYNITLCDSNTSHSGATNLRESEKSAEAQISPMESATLDIQTVNEACDLDKPLVSGNSEPDKSVNITKDDNGSLESCDKLEIGNKDGGKTTLFRDLETCDMSTSNSYVPSGERLPNVVESSEDNNTLSHTADAEKTPHVLDSKLEELNIGDTDD